jgi:hypothetical protein
MLALVSIQVNASSETWDQKLDLTIPSLEMPSTLQLDSKAKHAITMGWTCCYHPSLVKAVHLENSLKSIPSLLKERQSPSPFTLSIKKDWLEPADWHWWAALTLVNIADVHSTNQAMKYECVYEANPLLPNKPSLERLIAHKAITLYPIYHPDYNRYVVQNKDIMWATGMIALVAYHNYRLIDKVKKYPDRCPKVSTV